MKEKIGVPLKSNYVLSGRIFLFFLMKAEELPIIIIGIVIIYA